MSIRLNSNSEYLGRTSGLTGYNAAYTVAFWVKRKAAVTYGHMWAASASTTQVSGNYVNSDFAGFTSDGTGWRVSAYAGGSTAGDGGSGTCALDTWYHVAIVRESATALKLYVNGVQSGATCTTNVSGRAAVGGEWIGNFHGIYNSDIEIAGFKSWSRALTSAEINDEAGQYLPVDSTNLVSCSPFTVESGSPADVAEALTAQNGTAFSATGAVTLGATEPSGVVWGGGSSPVSVSGQTLTATASLIAGAVTGAASVSGQTLTAATSLIAGAASTAGSVSVAGQTLTTAASLIAGAVTGAAAVAGQTLTASASLVVGAATGAASVTGQVLTATGSLIAGAVTGAASVSGQVLTATTSLIAGAVSGGTVTVAGQILTVTATLISGMGGAVAGLWGRVWRGSLWSGGVFRG